jgi:hypothetical protein
VNYSDWVPNFPSTSNAKKYKFLALLRPLPNFSVPLGHLLKWGEISLSTSTWKAPQNDIKWFQNTKQIEKIWCASRAREYFPHIANYTEGAFILQTLYEETLKIFYFLNSEYVVLFLDPELLIKIDTRFNSRRNLLSKTFIPLFWVEICMGGTLNTQN